MIWIESHTNLLRHRKLVELAKALRLRPVYLMGHLHALWHVALEQQEDGNLSAWSDEFIAESSAYPGDAHQYVRLLTEHGWLDPNRVLHDWLDYAGRYLIRKYGTSNRPRIKAIWAAHGRSGTGVSPPRHSSDLTSTITERDLKGEVGRVSGDSKGGEDPYTVDDCVAAAARYGFTAKEGEDYHTACKQSSKWERPLNHFGRLLNRLRDEQAEKIYAVYPRKVGKPKALKSILHALASVPFDEVLEATAKYAQARCGHDSEFTPHPATWFNQARYNDDPATWVQEIKTATGSPQPTTGEDRELERMRKARFQLDQQ